ncbi:hypothetical protein BJP25_20765 [Actinokineospora bangkokensis]|uniref:Uncharacterized protein n=1 Tax=Actinokineospora bangkokensis TaxID=1193682 RepID=A0A1Q9LKH3_9PSEU|nr:hypothetical protein BJP25_20765 [Actinokineospora bangkokensis]
MAAEFLAAANAAARRPGGLADAERLACVAADCGRVAALRDPVPPADRGVARLADLGAYLSAELAATPRLGEGGRRLVERVRELAALLLGASPGPGELPDHEGEGIARHQLAGHHQVLERAAELIAHVAETGRFAGHQAPEVVALVQLAEYVRAHASALRELHTGVDERLERLLAE